MHRPIRALVLLSILVAALPAASATAGPVVQIGSGRQPSAAIEPATGALFAVWSDQTASRTVRYCRLPRGRTDCDVRADLSLAPGDTPAGDVLGEAFILRDPASGALYITSDAGAGEFLWTSTDGGATWTGPATINGQTNGSPTTAPVLGPQPGTITVAAENPKTVFTTTLAPGPAVTAAALPGSGDSGFGIVATADGEILGTAGAGSDTYVWRLAAGLNANLDANWSGALLAPGESYPRLATGSSGTFVATVASAAPYDVLLRRRVAGASFGAPVKVGRGETAAEPALVVGPSGQVTAIWRLNTAGATVLRAATSTDGGTTFGAPYSFADEQAGAVYPRVVLAQDGKGSAVWQGGPNDYRIRTATLDPIGPAGTGTARVIRGAVPGASIDLGVPSACVQPGTTFKVTLTWKRQKRKGNLFVKVNRADFSIGSVLATSDRRAPFVQTLKVTASARKGSTITLRARAFIKVRHGRVPKKSITAKIKVCS